VVDASNLERNLFLVSQLLELERPVVIALNMMDVAAARGQRIDVAALSQRLGVPVIATQANRRLGMEHLKNALENTDPLHVPPQKTRFPVRFVEEVARLRQSVPPGHEPLPRYLAERLLLDTSGYLSNSLLPAVNGFAPIDLADVRQRLASDGVAIPGIEAITRYGWAGEMLSGVIDRTGTRRLSVSDRIDRVLTHRAWGTLVFAALMLIVFQSGGRSGVAGRGPQPGHSPGRSAIPGH
jgi:ferrous iron transport protein B